MPQRGHLLLLKTLEGFLGLSTLLPHARGALCHGLSGFPLSLSTQPVPTSGPLHVQSLANSPGT